MMELKLKEVDLEKYSVSNEKGIKIKPFLSIVELNTIVSDMKSQPTSLARHFSKIVLLTDFCSNLNLEGMIADDVYDLASELRLIDEYSINIQCYNEIDNLVKDDESTYVLLKDITDKLGDKLETMELGGNGISDVVKQLSEMKEVIK